MKNRIKTFLRLRKQNDLVKIICILGLAGVGFFASVMYHVWGLYQYVDTPAEYVLTGNEGISKKGMDELEHYKGVMQVSRQMDTSVTLTYKGSEGTMECTMLSQEYMENMFHIKVPSGTKRFYMNETAFDQWKQALMETNEQLGSVVGTAQSDGNLEIDVHYSMLDISADDMFSGGGDVSAGEVYKTAKLVVIKNEEENGEEEKSFVCTVGTDSQLLKDAFKLRVKFAKHDLDGLQVSKLRKMNYVIENEDVVITEEYEIKMKLFHAQYGLLCLAICAVAVFALGRAVKKGAGR